MKKTQVNKVCDWHIVTVYGCDDIDVEHPDTCKARHYTDITGEVVYSWDEHDCLIAFELDGCGFEGILQSYENEDCKSKECYSWPCYQRGVYKVRGFVYRCGGWEFPDEYDVEIETIKFSKWQRFVRAIRFQVGLR